MNKNEDTWRANNLGFTLRMITFCGCYQLKCCLFRDTFSGQPICK